MAAKSLKWFKIEQNSPIHILKLIFEPVVLIDCMFQTYEIGKDAFNFNNQRTNEKSKWLPTNSTWLP